jgi:DNA-binding GntR family transcriptional regulator
MKTAKPSAVASKKRVVARHRIREAIHGQILDGQCKPGTKLRQQQLAEQFGVSMGLIREALLELQAWGLVEVHDNRGIYVRSWDAGRILETYEIREVLEGLAARRCCGRASKQQLSQLRRLAQDIFNHARADQWEESAQLEREFHGRIIQWSGSEIVSRLAANYHFLGKLVWVRSDPRATKRGHLKIVRAIRANDPARAEAAAREHVLVGRRLLEKRIAERGSNSNWVV